MEKDYLIKLSLAVYRVTEVFPAQEPLKFAIREKANQILADLVCQEQKSKVSEQILGNIEVLKGYFELAKGQKWIDERNFFVLEKEYDKIREEIKKGSLKKEKKLVKPRSEKNSLPFNNLRNERWRKILEVLKQKERVQIWELKNIFPQVSKRTLRRDFDYLLRKGLVERIGDGKGTFYRFNRTQIRQQ
ncbi:DeoR family transcriptional regulator [Patescibacteria group bacterium]|nr:DeoR family transcriptional regulator [Patescibacteria group bacterium]